MASPASKAARRVSGEPMVLPANERVSCLRGPVAAAAAPAPSAASGAERSLSPKKMKMPKAVSLAEPAQRRGSEQGHAVAGSSHVTSSKNVFRKFSGSIGHPDSPVRATAGAMLQRFSEGVSQLILDDTDRVSSRDRQGVNRLVIHPGNRLYATFDLIVVIATLYTVYIVPLQVAFGTTVGQGWQVLIDILFATDVVMQFFHGFVERGYPVLNLRHVAATYMRTWFIIEFAAALPLDRITGLPDARVVALLRVVSLRRHLNGSSAISNRINTTSSNLSAFLRVIYILIVWLVVAHMFACVFFGLGWRMRCSGLGYEETWISVYWPRLELPACPAVGQPPTPPSAVELELSSLPANAVPVSEMYVLSLHWAISSMSSLGYVRGPSALTVAEFGFSIACQVFGACMYAAIFGNIAQLIAKLDAPGARYRAQRDKIDEFIQFHTLPTKMTNKLHAYNKFLFAVNHGFDVGQISGALPPNLQHQLLLHLHAPLVRSVPMFEQCDDAFIKALVLQLRPQVLLGGDAAFHSQEVGTEMYFIMRGEMRMMDETLTVCYNALYSGAYFGELAMLTGQPRTATALAVTHCVLFYIQQTDFEKVAHKWPKALATILAKAKERLDRVASSNSDALAAQDVVSNRLAELHEHQRLNDDGRPAWAQDNSFLTSCSAFGRYSSYAGARVSRTTGGGGGDAMDQKWRDNVERGLRESNATTRELLRRIEAQGTAIETLLGGRESASAPIEQLLSRRELGPGAAAPAPAYAAPAPAAARRPSRTSFDLTGSDVPMPKEATSHLRGYKSPPAKGTIEYDFETDPLSV